MTAKVTLPIEAQIQVARLEMAADAASAGKRPSVTDLAHRVGLTNATFWRHFPGIAREVAAERRLSPPSGPPGPSERPPDRRHEEARLRCKNRTLTEQLEFAIDNLQRLTLENHRLRRELEQLSNVSRLPTS